MSYFDFETVQTHDKKMQDALRLATQMAPTQASVMIVGESGVGKTSLAHYIHRKSRRSQLHVVDCKNLHADTAFDFSEGTTLLLENIDQASSSAQASLVKYLDESNGARPRIICTSRRDLRSLVRQEQFRHDLFYKLSVIYLELPSLQERKADFIGICNFVLDVNQIIHGKQGLRLSPEAYGRLSTWAWPGNIRELENVLERSVILSQGPSIDADQLTFESLTNEQVADFAPGMSLSEVEKKLILQTLELTAHNRTRAAQILGISIRTLRNKLNEYREEGYV